MGKVLREKKFHSHELVPLHYAKKGSEEIANFEANLRRSYFYNEGEEVVHKHNPEQEMIVSRILTKDAGKGKKPHLDGIVCHWWEDA